MTGRLIGVGVGPGDPELITLKAVRAIASADAVAFIAAPGRPSRARTIAAAHLSPGRPEIAVVMPMEGSGAGRESAYRELVAAIDAALAQGRTVAFLCEGDPLLYGSFLHVLARLGPQRSIAIVPGVSSMSAAAAACTLPLAVGNGTLTIVPATVGEPQLRAVAERDGTVVVIKLSRHFAMAKRVMAETGRLDRSVLVVDVGSDRERIVPLGQADAAPYFSLVLAPGSVP